jgi:Zn-dependent alcohol dehydrogenase
LRAADFITHEFPVERIAEAVDAVCGGEALKVLLRY